MLGVEQNECPEVEQRGLGQRLRKSQHQLLNVWQFHPIGRDNFHEACQQSCEVHRQIIVSRLVEHLADELQRVHAIVAFEHHPCHDLNHVPQFVAINQVRQCLLLRGVVRTLQAIGDLLKCLCDQRQKYGLKSLGVDVDLEQNDQIVGNHAVAVIALERVGDVSKVAVLLGN